MISCFFRSSLRHPGKSRENNCDVTYLHPEFRSKLESSRFDCTHLYTISPSTVQTLTSVPIG
jgi:hypothetical protein